MIDELSDNKFPSLPQENEGNQTGEDVFRESGEISHQKRRLDHRQNYHHYARP